MSSEQESQLATTCTLCSGPFFVRDVTKLRNSRCPMLLRCGHTACYTCLSSNANLCQSVACKSCGSVTALSPSTDIDKVFRVNYHLLGLILFKHSQQPSVFTREDEHIQFIPAGASLDPFNRQVVRQTMTVHPMSKENQCIECSVEVAMCRCEQCDAIYCHGCFAKVHSSGRALRKHRKTLIHDTVNMFKLPDCPQHPEKTISFFCEQDNVSVCPTCAVLKHNGHDLKEIIQKNNELLPEVKQSIGHPRQK